MDRYRQIVELSQDCIKEVGLDGIVLSVNEKGLKLLRADTAEQVVSRVWREMWPAEARHLVDQALHEARSGRAYEFESACRIFSGDLREWYVRTTPLRTDGVVTGMLAVSADVTDRNASLASLKMLHRALEMQLDTSEQELSAASLRERQLSHELNAQRSKLYDTNHAYQQLEVRHFLAMEGREVAHTAQRAAEMISQQAQKGEAIGQLLSGVVHDLNNVLHAATTAIELVMARGRIADDDAALLGAAERALDHGAVMSRRLLGFSREHPYVVASVNLAEMITDMRGLLEQAIGPGAKLKIDLHEGGCCAMVDQHTVERALINLVINARDASPAGGEIRVCTGDLVVDRDDGGIARPVGEYVTLTVADDGAGIPEDIKSRLFDVYFTTKEAGKGSGLGLAQVHSAATQAGGFVDVESMPGAGARFILAFPKVTGRPAD